MSEQAKHTPGPWRVMMGRTVAAQGSTDTYSGPVWGGIASVHDTEEVDGEGRTWFVAGDADANARLIAAAPDHALIAAALCSGAARWEGSEFCIGGLRHSTKLDEFGVPIMTGGMRAALASPSSKTGSV